MTNSDLFNNRLIFGDNFLAFKASEQEFGCIQDTRFTELLTELLDVQAKKATAVQWCRHATHHAVSNDGKLWQYVLIPHDAIAKNMTIAGLANQFLAR